MMKSDKGYYCFDFEGHYYLYDFMCGVILEINKAFYTAVREYEKYGQCRSADHKLIEMLSESGMFQNFETEPSPDPLEDQIAYLSFAPTYKCNFRCSYCFADCGEKYKGIQREFTKHSLIQMLNYFFFTAYPEAKQYRIDFVSGGEPLLGLDIIKKTIAYAEDYTVSTGKQVSIWLCTNGSLITDEIIEYFNLHNVSIGISIDGRKKYNDAVRRDYVGNGTYDQICRGISIVQNNPHVGKKIKCLWGLATATNQNCDFVDILCHMQELGFQNAQIRLIRSEKEYALKEILSQYNRLADFLLMKYAQGDLSYLKMILNDNDQFGKVLKRILLSFLIIRRCNAGVNKITICPDGTIYPCDSLVGMSKFCLGNIFDGYDTSFYKRVTVNSISRCTICDVKYLCGGDCYYNSCMKTGRPFTPDNEFCLIQRHIIKLSIVLRYKMEQMDSARYEKLLKEVKMKNEYAEIFG